MTLEQRCREAEVRLENIRTLLLRPQTDQLSLCENELKEVVFALQNIVGSRPAKNTPTEGKTAIYRLRQVAGKVALQVRHASNLCMGLAQLYAASGYTNQGRPLFLPAEARASYDA